MLSTTIGPAIDWLEPTARNSNLLPVKANGLVRLRSPASRGRVGRTDDADLQLAAGLGRLGAALLDLLEDVVELSPRKIEMMAGGASLAPRRWSLPAWATASAQQVAVPRHGPDDGGQKTRNWAFSCGVSPGSSRLFPRSSDIDQLRCLPEPLTPANGFSCSRQLKAVAVGDPLERLHDQHVVVGGDVGVLEDRGDLVLAGATSLCRVLTGTPSL